MQYREAYKPSSFLANEIESYIAFKINVGYQRYSFYRELYRFDRFLNERSIHSGEITYELIDDFIHRKEGRSSASLSNEWQVLKGFFNYLYDKGYKIPLLQNSEISVKRKFIPHIYTKDEIDRYFEAVDHYKSSKSWLPELQAPIIFRLLYCCGFRVGECIGIKKKDIDFKLKSIILRKTKLGNERQIFLNDDLTELLRNYANKIFYRLKEDDYIFRTRTGNKMTPYLVHKMHKQILEMANIPFLGNGQGPRVHDWRHTFAVTSLQMLLNLNISFNKAIILLSETLGHKNVTATEYYLRLTAQRFPEIIHNLTQYLELQKHEEN